MSLRVGIIGMGGFAGAHHDFVSGLEDEGRCRLVCTCDPERDAFADRARELRFEERGVEFMDDYVAMLDAFGDQLDAVMIPTPIPLHAPMHRACVERGVPVYLEKPPTLSCQELEEMLAVENRAQRSTNVGFNYIAEPERQELKHRIVAGEFGTVRRVCLLGLTVRPRSYFLRAPWAGRLMLDGRLVLDSCFGNAMAHLVHDVLFWAGTGEVFSWASIENVDAELYRAHDIEGFDTVFATARTKEGPEIRAGLSHACEQKLIHRETVVCDRATIHYDVGSSYRVEHEDGSVESGDVQHVFLKENLCAYFDYLEGRAQRPLNQLADCRPFVAFNSLLYVAAGRINRIDDRHLAVAGSPGPDERLAIAGLTEVSEAFLRSGAFPSRQSAPWAGAGGCAAASDVSRLPEAIRRIIG